MSLTRSSSCSFRPAARGVDEQPHPEGPRPQTSVVRFDAVVSITSPSVELWSWLRSGNWVWRQRTPNLTHDRFCQSENVLCHVTFAFLCETNGSRFAVRPRQFGAGSDWLGGQSEVETQRPRARAPKSSRSSCSCTIRSYDCSALLIAYCGSRCGSSSLTIS